VTEVRALLALLRENETRMLPVDLLFVQMVMRDASRVLKVLAPKHGEKKLIKSMASQLAKLVALWG
jgi:hypothetical protein